jgi:hypothetical protein
MKAGDPPDTALTAVMAGGGCAIPSVQVCSNRERQGFPRDLESDDFALPAASAWDSASCKRMITALTMNGYSSTVPKLFSKKKNGKALYETYNIKPVAGRANFCRPARIR